MERVKLDYLYNPMISDCLKSTLTVEVSRGRKPCAGVFCGRWFLLLYTPTLSLSPNNMSPLILNKFGEFWVSIIKTQNKYFFAVLRNVASILNREFEQAANN